MRIFHGPANTAGAAGILAKAQREIGVEAFSYCMPTPYQYQVDRTLQAQRQFDRTIELLLFLLKERLRFDVFQFYFGTSLTFQNLQDIPWLKRLGKKVFFYFAGCDIRDSKHTIETYEFSACKHHWPMACSANRKKAIEVAQKYADGVFVSTPDLLEFMPGSTLLPQPIDMSYFLPLRDKALATATRQAKEQDPIRIVHAPSDRQIKGTIYLEQAVAELQEAGYQIDLKLIENTPYEETLRIGAEADIIVDQLLIGAYGTFAVEMMALGKPVICYIREDLQKYYSPNMPLISANPKTITQTIKDVIHKRGKWAEIGQQGMSFAEQTHDSQIIAKTMIESYRKIS